MSKARTRSLRAGKNGQSCFKIATDRRQDSHGITDPVISGHPIHIRGNPVTMRIGIDGRALQDQPWGGVGHYTYQLLHALFSLDKENEYTVSYNARGVLTIPTFSAYPNVKINRTYLPNKLLNFSIKTFNRPLLDLGPIDLFFLPNPNFVALLPGVKLVAVAHDLSFEHFPEFLPLKSRLWHRAVNPRTLFNRADHIIAVSEHTKNDLMETYTIANEKVTTVYPGVKMQNAECRMQNAQPYILSLGALEPRKNIEGLIQAYELSEPHEQLVIAGLTTPYVKHLKKRIAKSPLRTKIALIENPTEEQKNDLYCRASLFVYPSFYEGFGFPPLEAMSAGVAVVASSASSVREVCNEAALLVNPWDSTEIAQGMKILLEDETLRTRYIEAGKKRVAQFRWDTSARKVLNIFKTLYPR